LVFVGRCGLAARGLIYFTVGALAGLAALGSGEGETTDAQGAASTIDQLPLGQVLLMAAGVGLAGYALWRLLQAALDLEGDSPGHSTGKRVMLGADGLFHGGLAFMVFSVAVGSRGGDAEQDTKDWTASVMAQPFGQWVVMIGGALAVAAGLFLIYRSLKHDYADNVRRCAEGWPKRALQIAGKVGESTRALVFAIVGIFLLRAGWQHDPDESIGVAGAMHALAAQPLGWLWLSVIALGFLAFGVYSFLESRYRQIRS
jgi:hypothetical protein